MLIKKNTNPQRSKLAQITTRNPRISLPDILTEKSAKSAKQSRGHSGNPTWKNTSDGAALSRPKVKTFFRRGRCALHNTYGDQCTANTHVRTKYVRTKQCCDNVWHAAMSYVFRRLLVLHKVEVSWGEANSSLGRRQVD